jgi:hypothetical protein
MIFLLTQPVSSIKNKTPLTTSKLKRMDARCAHKHENRKETKQIHYTYSKESEKAKLQIILGIF